jgi:hypothetical protein
MLNTLSKNHIVLENNNQNKRYIRKVNHFLFYIIESLIESMLLYSVELEKKDIILLFLQKQVYKK